LRTDNHTPVSNADCIGFELVTRKNSYLCIVLAEDWFLYCEDQDGLMWSFNTELWLEWADFREAYLGNGEGPYQMAAFAWQHEPQPCTDDKGNQINRRQFDAGILA
jgi:hypothetical protein